jgi:hypothetical protein
VHKEFIPEGKTVNAEFYKGIKDHLLKHIHTKDAENVALLT